MSFTSDVYSEILSDISLGTSKTSPFAMRRVEFVNGVMIVFAIHVATKRRAAFLSVTEKVDKNKFPHWKGVAIEPAKLPSYGIDTPFIVLYQLPDNADDIFEIVIEDLRKNLEIAKNEDESLSVIISILAKWKKFFDSDKNLLMSEERQQGLYGELLFLDECLNAQGTAAVLHWAGSEDETHDFYFGPYAVEIKTTSTQTPYFAHISSEYQLDKSDIPEQLFLRFYALRKSQSGGEKLPERIASIREKLSEDVANLQKFNEKLNMYGYFDEVADNYTTGYYERDRYCFALEDDFPKIIKEDVPLGVSDLTYKVSIALCMPYAQEMKSVFKVLKGGT